MCVSANYFKNQNKISVNLNKYVETINNDYKLLNSSQIGILQTSAIANKDIKVASRYQDHHDGNRNYFLLILGKIFQPYAWR